MGVTYFSVRVALRRKYGRHRAQLITGLLAAPLLIPWHAARAPLNQHRRAISARVVLPGPPLLVYPAGQRSDQGLSSRAGRRPRHRTRARPDRRYLEPRGAGFDLPGVWEHPLEAGTKRGALSRSCQRDRAGDSRRPAYHLARSDALG